MSDASDARYRVFTRTWWRMEGGRRVPGIGKSSYRGHPDSLTYDEARDYCQKWNASHPPGRLSRKAEFESY